MKNNRSANPLTLALILAFIVVAITAAFSACGNNKTASTSETTTTASSTETSTTESATESTTAAETFYAEYIGVASHNKVVCYNPDTQEFAVNSMKYYSYNSDGIESIILFGIAAPIEDISVDGYKILDRKVLATNVYQLELDLFKERHLDGSRTFLTEGSLSLYGEKLVNLRVVTG